MKPIIKLVLSSRVVNIGRSPASKAEEFIAQGRKSRLWLEIKRLMDEQFCNDSLDAVEIFMDRGLQVVLENYKTVPVRSAPVCRQTRCGDGVFTREDLAPF